MIEGLEHLEKNGWEIVRFDCVSPGECYVGHDSEAWKWDGLGPSSAKHIIIRKTKKPKQYRPFANAAEFKPHRDRWIRRLANGGAFLVSDYSNEGFCCDELNPISWGELFNMGYVFDNPDGTTEPFGVEVQS